MTISNEYGKVDMNCPMCGNEMISGIVQSDRDVLWIEENKNPQRITSKLFVHSKENVERCVDCEIVVIKKSAITSDFMINTIWGNRYER